MNTILLENKASYNFYPAQQQKGIVIYLHGGGLIYGSKIDIPSTLINIFNESNYSVIALDYLLAPNSSLKDIIEDLEISLDKLLNTTFKGVPFILCGRSAGAFLCNLIYKNLINKNNIHAEKLILFYGYYNLDFYESSPNKLNIVDRFKEVPKIDTKNPIRDDKFFNRYLYYQNALNNNSMISELKIDPSNNQYRVEMEEFKLFPPTFLTASVNDKEVPFSYSKNQHKASKNSKFYPMYYLEHDFLSEIENPEVINLLNKLKLWLNNDPQ